MIKYFNGDLKNIKLVIFFCILGFSAIVIGITSLSVPTFFVGLGSLCIALIICIINCVASMK